MKIILVMILMYSALFGVSQKQLNTLQLVRDIAKTIKDKKGRTYENVMSSICLTESSAGKNIIGDFTEGTSIIKASLGIMQVQVATAKHVATYRKNFKWLLKKSDVEIANLLLTNNFFSASIATTYIVMLINARPTFYNAISGYNGGWENTPYYNRVLKNLELVKKLVKKKKIY